MTIYRHHIPQTPQLFTVDNIQTFWQRNLHATAGCPANLNFCQSQGRRFAVKLQWFISFGGCPDAPRDVVQCMWVDSKILKEIWEWISFFLIVGLFVLDFFYTDYGYTIIYYTYIHTYIILCIFSFAASIALERRRLAIVWGWADLSHPLIVTSRIFCLEILGTMDHIYIQTIAWLPNLCHSQTVIYHFLDLTFDWICYFDSSIGPFKRKGFSSTRSRPTKGGSSVWWPSRWSWRGFCRCYNRRFFWGAMFGCIPVQKCRSNDHLIITISSLFWVFTSNCLHFRL